MQKYHTGNLDILPIQINHINKNSPQYIINKHWHPLPEIIMISKGTLKVESNNHSVLAQKDDIVFINNSVNYSLIPDDCVFVSIVFSYELLKSSLSRLNVFIENLENGSYVIKEHFPADNYETDKELRQTLMILIEALEQERDYSIVIGILYYFMGLISENRYYSDTSLLSKTNIPNNKELNTVFAYIKENYNKKISLSDMAKSINMSTKYFNNFFKKNTNLTPFEFLMQYRIEQACVQLIQTDINVTDIAYNVGFNDLSYFINVFKRYKGTSPLKFKKSHQNI